MSQENEKPMRSRYNLKPDASVKEQIEVFTRERHNLPDDESEAFKAFQRYVFMERHGLPDDASNEEYEVALDNERKIAVEAQVRAEYGLPATATEVELRCAIRLEAEKSIKKYYPDPTEDEIKVGKVNRALELQKSIRKRIRSQLGLSEDASNSTVETRIINQSTAQVLRDIKQSFGLTDESTMDDIKTALRKEISIELGIDENEINLGDIDLAKAMQNSVIREAEMERFMLNDATSFDATIEVHEESVKALFAERDRIISALHKETETRSKAAEGRRAEKDRAISASDKKLEDLMTRYEDSMAELAGDISARREKN